MLIRLVDVDNQKGLLGRGGVAAGNAWCLTGFGGTRVLLSYSEPEMRRLLSLYLGSVTSFPL